METPPYSCPLLAVALSTWTHPTHAALRQCSWKLRPWQRLLSDSPPLSQPVGGRPQPELSANNLVEVGWSPDSSFLLHCAEDTLYGKMANGIICSSAPEYSSNSKGCPYSFEMSSIKNGAGSGHCGRWLCDSSQLTKRNSAASYLQNGFKSLSHGYNCGFICMGASILWGVQ